jgi:protein arginine kinase activator
MDTSLVCGECGTTLQEVKRGVTFGCNLCYDVFAPFVFEDILDNGECMHLGRNPGEIREMGSSIKLIALSEALDETIKREDYEQAALLRDQIKQITEIKKQEREEK